jgi:hypothetical protein
MESVRATGLGLLPPPQAGEGWGGGEFKCSIMLRAPSLPLPRKRGRGTMWPCPSHCDGR